MSTEPFRVVFDCNVYFQALLNDRGPAGRCVQAALDGRLRLYWSEHVVAEIRGTASNTDLRSRFRQLTDERLDMLMLSVANVAMFVEHVPAEFELPRDPDDAHYINLALATNSRVVVSRDRDRSISVESQRTAELSGPASLRSRSWSHRNSFETWSKLGSRYIPQAQ